MERIRKAIVDDLSEILEDEFGESITLIDPDGVSYSVEGSTTMDSVSVDQMGMVQIVNKPQVILRINSLDRVPVSGENWVIKFNDVSTGDTYNYMLEKAEMHGRSFGYVVLNLTKAVQS